MPTKFEPATGNPRLNGVVIDADEKTGKATSITRISCSERELLELGERAPLRQPVGSQ
jgi:calcineurin-like phosphoesterase